MSIRLDISVLNDTIQVCNSVSERLGDSANEAMSATFGLGDSWHGSSYDELVNYANSSLVPCASIVSGAAKTLALGLEEVRKVASRLLSRARGFQGIFNGEGVASPSEDLTSGVLYYDENYDYLIYSAIVNARNEIASARRELSDVNTELSKLQTIVHPIDTTYAFGELQSISNRIDEFEASYSSFKTDLENLEAASRRCEEKLDGVFNVTETSQVYEIGAVKNMNALTWLLSLPDVLKTPEARAVTKDFRNEGLSVPARDIQSLRVYGLDGGTPEEQENLLIEVLEGAGYYVTPFELGFSMVEHVTRFAGRLSGESLYYEQFFTEKSTFGKTKSVVSWIGHLLNGVTASAKSLDYYDSATYLGSSRRLNNESMVWDVEFVIGEVGILPPISDYLNKWVYEKDPETNLSRFDHFANVRYEAFGKYGL